MKNINIKIIAIVLCLILSISAIALAENGKPSIDGFDIATNWAGQFRGLCFSFPSYLEVDPSSTESAVTMYVQGMTMGNGYPPAYILLDLVDGINTQSDFASRKEDVLNRQLQIWSNAELTQYVEDCRIAFFPATGMQYSYQDSDGSWICRVYLLYNTQSDETIAVTIMENVDSPADFMSDFEKIVDSITLMNTGYDAASSQSATAQVSPKVKQLCDDYLESVTLIMQKLSTVDIDTMDFVDAFLIYTDLSTALDNFNAFQEANTQGWSEADIAYYRQADSAVGDAVAQQIISFIRMATRGFLKDIFS